MKIQYVDIISSEEAFSKLASGNLSLKVAYRLRKIIDLLSKENSFFWEQRDKIMKKYKPKNERSEEETEKLTSELDELLNLEIEVDIERLTISSSEDVRLSLHDMNQLKKFVEFVE